MGCGCIQPKNKSSIIQENNLNIKKVVLRTETQAMGVLNEEDFKDVFVEFYFSCKDLINLDILSKTDCALAIFISDSQGQEEKIGQTETIIDNLNPKFIKTVTTKYIFADQQKLKIRAYDVDDFSKSAKLENQEYIGCVEVPVSMVLTAPKQTIKRQILNPKKSGKKLGTLIIRAEELKHGSNNMFIFQLFGTHFQQNKLFYRLYRSINKYDYLPVFESEVCIGEKEEKIEMIETQFEAVEDNSQSFSSNSDDSDGNSHSSSSNSNSSDSDKKNSQEKSSKNPKTLLKKPSKTIVYEKSKPKKKITVINLFKFRKFEIGAFQLIRDEMKSKVKLDTFEYKKSGNHKLVGSSIFLISNLFDDDACLEIFNSAKEKTGLYHVAIAKFEERDSFLDYIFSGLEVDLMVGIDFTLSNGEIHNKESLHYFDPNENQYLQAIKTVGKILEAYDTNKKISLIGFGASIMDAMPDRPSHCFALNGNIFDPEVYGLVGIIESYKRCLEFIKLSGPTKFHHLLQSLNELVEFEQNNLMLKYHILLLITDGIINDFDETVDQIIRASSLPISIIIVGVGDEDFSEMIELDADYRPLFSKRLNRKQNRDIVQFVPFKEYKDNLKELAKATLNEVPKQLTSFMASQLIKPKHLNPQTKKFKVDFGNNAFFEYRKEQVTKKLIKKGVKEEIIKDILSRIIEYDVDYIYECINNMHFKNPLAI